MKRSDREFMDRVAAEFGGPYRPPHRVPTLFPVWRPTHQQVAAVLKRVFGILPASHGWIDDMSRSRIRVANGPWLSVRALLNEPKTFYRPNVA